MHFSASNLLTLAALRKLQQPNNQQIKNINPLVLMRIILLNSSGDHDN
jgi:hypothetical protein